MTSKPFIYLPNSILQRLTTAFRIRVSILSFVIIFLATTTCPALAADKDNIPPGMEIRKVGDLQILVPKGAEVTRTGKGGLIRIESTSEYTSRELIEINRRLESLQKNQEMLNNKLHELQEAIDALRDEKSNLRSDVSSSQRR